EAARREVLWDILQTSVNKAKQVLQSSGCEAYIEVESYTYQSRRIWKDRPMSSDWEFQFPLAPGQLINIDPPCTAADSRARGLPREVVKLADIHVKITRHPENEEGRLDLLERMVEAGFYHVV